ncbi:hypothetical protein WBJ53_11600 [Spirosoma sp. SC4-14]|uniref:hypothetical protein n=1 Tax=Spirosoma sp. SC4-14 TaxID=3128900 RepID=UPI0030CC89EB
MKKSLLLLGCLASFFIAAAQHSERQVLEDSVMGWYTKLSPADKPVKPLLSGGKTFSIRQQEINNLFVQWMQQSYTPVGGLGVFKKRYYAKKDEYFPQAYGIFFQAYNAALDVRDKQGHLKPVDETWVPFQIAANVVFDINPAYYLNTPSQYVFTLLPDGYMDSDFFRKKFKDADPKRHPNMAKYLTTMTSNGITVYLVPGNKLPIRQLTKGEFIQLSDESFERHLQQKKEDVARQFSSEQARVEVMASEREKVKTYREKLKALRDQYATRLNEPAIIRDMQPTIYTVDGSSDPFKIDPFSKGLMHEYGVYTYEPAIYEKCKTDQPQWIAIRFPYATKENGRKEHELYRAISEHFNFEYVYNYFFDPDKVKGQPYRPVNEELLKMTLANYAKRTYWKNSSATSSLPAGVLFLDDFSVNEAGARPAGWYFYSYGKASQVTTVKNLPGKWLQLGYGNRVDPTALPKPLPENFSLEYDIATDEFSSRTGGAVELELAGGLKGNPKSATTRIRVQITAGNEADYHNNNYRGLAKIELVSFPLVKSNTYVEAGGQSVQPLTTFTNRQNRVHVKLQKEGSEVRLFLNNKPFATSSDFKSNYDKPCQYCTIPAGIQFSTINWVNMTDDAENVRVYISNVKLSKQ